MQPKLPPESQRIAELAEQQPPEAQEVFQFMLAVAMEESGIAKMTNTAQIDGRTWYSCESASGDVYSVGGGLGDNSYGHPAEETLTRLGESGARVLRTDLRGTVMVASDGTSYRVRADFQVFPPLISRHKNV
jgi:hypothetical protein